MTIVLIKLKWVHYNLNTRLCLNCILMSPNWLRWMLSLVVINGWDSLLCDRLVTRPLMDAALDQMRLGENKCTSPRDSAEPLMSVSVSNACVRGLWQLVTRRRMGAGCGLGWSLSCPPHICYWPGRDQIQNVEEITIVWSEMIMMMRMLLAQLEII